ncbi:MAG: invasion associated locus B family protein [Alphaproteobacteria bacterium]|nr:invasion associated locus B family protein [Alphaproteobacteria bacterium]QQS58070.1 MAG: invasion associated locus B family protein [Alphaproteobacteria bacterium]
MTKANMLLGGVVFVLGLVALSMVLSPDIVSDLTARGSQVTQTITPRSLIRTESAIQNQSAAHTSQQKPQDQPMAEISPDFKMSGADQTVKAEDHGDWRVECTKTPEGNPVCQMFQRLLWKDQKSVALLVMGAMGDRDGQMIPRMRFIVPMGTFLPPGLILSIDGEKEYRIPIQFCVQQGCVVNLDLGGDIVEKLKGGSALRAVYMRPDRLTASLQVSLKGFPEALERIKNP